MSKAHFATALRILPASTARLTRARLRVQSAAGSFGHLTLSAGTATPIEPTRSALPACPASHDPQRLGWLRAAGSVVAVAGALYAFLASIRLLGCGFEMFGSGFSERLIATTSNPFAGLFIGILATSIVQSSSVTTSTVVGFVSAGLLSIENAVPVVMGANIGTTVTCTLVSLGHIGRPEEFRRAYAAATVHDFFNILTVLCLFPLELATGFLSRTATALAGLLTGGESVGFASPVKRIIDPAVDQVIGAIERIAHQHAAIATAALGALLLFGSLTVLVILTRALALGRAEVAIDRILGRGGPLGILIGTAITGTIQSSSVTTSLLVPLAGAGIVTLEQVYPVALGANIGTTVTALLASLAGDVRGLAIALTHTLFNCTGVLIFYPYKPLRRIPLFLARRLADAAVRSKRNVVLFVAGVFYVIPCALILIDRLH
jgi:sodium-dependent phosphate cotransporter